MSRKTKIALLLAGSLMAAAPAKADDVGAVIGGLSGLVLAGPPGAVVGVIVGAVFGSPFWGPALPGSCWIDTSFHRHCGQFPLQMTK